MNRSRHRERAAGADIETLAENEQTWLVNVADGGSQQWRHDELVAEEDGGQKQVDTTTPHRAHGGEAPGVEERVGLQRA